MKPKKKMQIDIAILQELLELKIVNKLHCIDTRFQLANALTKKGASSKKLLHVLKKEFF